MPLANSNAADCRLPTADSNATGSDCQLKTGNSVSDLPVTIYSPESPLANPGKLVKEIFGDIWRCRELTWILFTRDLKAQYRQSYFGYVWLFVPVISTTIVWMFLNSTQVIQVAETPIPYAAYVLLGSMIWGVFTASVNQPLMSFEAGKSVFMKLKVPPEAFILAGLSKIVFELLIKMIVLVPVFIALQIMPASTAFLFPVGMACTVLIGMAIGFLMIPIGSLYSDVGRLVTTGLSFGMYVTPVVYPPPTEGWAATLVQWNPLTPFVMATRDWLTLGHSEYALPMLIITAIAAVFLLIGMVIFRVVLPHLIERMGM
ncbi:MAG TPA: polysialic acid transporter [Planctomycetaceae bacterium]|nr:polysialic acid transporter [Planctomycetaceae bacterium]